jgi:hypothetical protein
MSSDGHPASRIMKVGEEPPIQSSPTKSITSAEPATAKVKSKAKAGSRFAVINNFIDVTMKGLSRAEVAVWLLLFRDTKREGLARTAQTDLARRAGTTTRTVERAVKALERRGLLTVVHRGGLRKGPSSYRVHPLIKEVLAPSTRAS